MQNKLKAVSLLETSSVHSPVSIEHQFVTDRHQVVAHIALCMCTAYESRGISQTNKYGALYQIVLHAEVDHLKRLFCWLNNSWNCCLDFYYI